MPDTMTVRHEAEVASLPEAGPRYAIPLGHLLADTLPQGPLCGTKTTTMTGPPTAQDEDSDNDQ
jgi:hypothetical protein